MTEPLARLRRVSRFFGERPVLKNLDLTVAPGRILLVVGPNGAGKSTLLRILAGLLPPSEGELVSSLAPGQVGYVGHRTLVYPKLTARANLRFWRAMHGLPKNEAAVEAVLGRVGLARFADEEAGVFSRGMAQRLSLARVLLTSPPLLLLDEPDSGLDPASGAWLRREIAQAGAEGTAVVWVSHHVQSDLPLADDVLCLIGGRAAHDGPARDFDPAVLVKESTC
jgi:heme exporter protein A